MADPTRDDYVSPREILNAVRDISRRLQVIEDDREAERLATLKAEGPPVTVYHGLEQHDGGKAQTTHLVVDTGHPFIAAGAVDADHMPMGHFDSAEKASAYVAAMRRAGHTGRLEVRPV